MVRVSRKFFNDLKKIVEWFFPEVINSASYFFSIIWICIYAASLTVFAFKFMPLLNKYNEKDVLVSIVVDDKMQLELPQITVCPGQMFAKSDIKAIKSNRLYELPLIDDNQKEYVMKILSINRRLEVPENNEICPENFWHCENYHQCIPDVWFCDKEADCVDGSDEYDNCTALYQNHTDDHCMTGWNYTRCSNSWSLRCAKRCDQQIECPSGEDEKHCSYNTYETQYYASNITQKIMSHPTYPLGTYENSLDVSYIIYLENSSFEYIRIFFENFNLEAAYQGVCKYDYVTIKEIDGEYVKNWKLNGSNKFCDSFNPGLIYLKAPVNISFSSDFTVTTTGFKFMYQASNNPRRNEHASSSQNVYKRSVSLETAKNNPLDITWKGIYKNITGKPPIDFSNVKKYLLFHPMVPYLFGPWDLVVKASNSESKDKLGTRIFLNSRCGKCTIIGANLANNSGLDSGINILVFVNENDDTGFYDRVGGVSITLDAKNTYPLPHKHGILIKSGTTTRISLKKKTIIRDSNNIKCAHQKPNWDPLEEMKVAVELGIKNREEYEYIDLHRNNYEDPFNKWPNYNQEVCWQYCLHENIRDACKCVDTYFNLYYDSNYIPNTPFPMCNPGNTTQMDCKSNITKSFHTLKKRDICNCPRSCHDNRYQVKMASGDFLSKQSMYYFIAEILDSRTNEPTKYMENLLQALINKNITENECLAKIRASFARIEIYFEDLEDETFTERPAYSFEQLLSAFAGNIGMFVGWSVLTFSQVFMLIFHLIYHFIVHKLLV